MDNIVKIRPLKPYLQDDGEQAWLCIDTRGVSKKGRYINIEVEGEDDAWIVDLASQLVNYIARRVDR